MSHTYIYIYICVTLRGWIKSAATHFISYKVRASRTVYTNHKILQKTCRWLSRGDTNYIHVHHYYAQANVDVAVTKSYMLLLIQESENHPQHFSRCGIQLLVLVRHQRHKGRVELLLADGLSRAEIVRREAVGYHHTQQLNTSPVRLGIDTGTAEVIVDYPAKMASVWLKKI